MFFLLIKDVIFFFFFFSSRRRHTRSDRDWSSDVCSSDLGQAIVIPGRSFSGKSLLVKALVKAGASYYSDEFAVLDERGRVHPYPIPLAIRPDRDGAPPMKYRAEELGGVAGVCPLPVGLVLITRYVSGTRFRPRPLSAGRAVLELLAHTLPARRRPGRVLDALTQAVAQASVL